MTTFRVRYFDDTVVYLSARSLSQARQAAVTLKPDQGFVDREATPEEQAALLAAHSLDPEVSDD